MCSSLGGEGCSRHELPRDLRLLHASSTRDEQPTFLPSGVPLAPVAPMAVRISIRIVGAPDPLHAPSRPSPIERFTTRIPGDHRRLAIPVPIPNTVVKQAPPMIVRRRESRLSPGSPRSPRSSLRGLLLFLDDAPAWIDWSRPRPTRRGRAPSGLDRGLSRHVEASRASPLTERDLGGPCPGENRARGLRRRTRSKGQCGRAAPIRTSSGDPAEGSKHDPGRSVDSSVLFNRKSQSPRSAIGPALHSRLRTRTGPRTRSAAPL